jgi:tetratricopeptide (TPR) repeat protein
MSQNARAYHLYSMAVQSLLDRDYAEAINLLEEALEREPAPDLLLETAQLYFSLNNVERATYLAEHLLEKHPDHAEAHRLLGDIYLSRAGEEPESAPLLAQAIQEYTAALTFDPASRETSRLLAEIYYQTGRLEEAAGVLDRFAARLNLDTQQALLHGRTLTQLGRHEEARALLEQVVAERPTSLEAIDSLAALYEYQEEFDAAIALYTPMLDDVGRRGYLQERIGTLQARAGRYPEAIASLEEARRLQPDHSRTFVFLAQAYENTGDLRAALRIYGERIEREPGDLEARFHRARLLHQDGDVEQALAGFEEIVGSSGERGGAFTDREATIIALAYSQIGLIMMNSRDLDAATEALGRALDLTPDPRPEMFLLLGRAELRRGFPNAAERVVAEAMRRFPDHLDLRILEGEALIVRGDRPQARQFYRDLLDERGHPAQGYVSVSEAFLRQNLYEEADSFLEEGTLLHPGNDRLYFARGAAMERLGRIGEAERFLVKAIGLNPDNAMALNYLGYMLADRGLKLDDSIAYIERALAMDPKNPAYLDSLGWALFKKSRFEPAEEHLRAATRYDRFDPTIREHLGDLLDATGRPEEALREWEFALGHGPEEPDRLQEKVERARSKLGVE